MPQTNGRRDFDECFTERVWRIAKETELKGKAHVTKLKKLWVSGIPIVAVRSDLNEMDECYAFPDDGSEELQGLRRYVERNGQRDTTEKTRLDKVTNRHMQGEDVFQDDIAQRRKHELRVAVAGCRFGFFSLL